MKDLKGRKTGCEQQETAGNVGDVVGMGNKPLKNRLKQTVKRLIFF